MVARSLTDTVAEMLLTGAVVLDEDFDGVFDVLSAVRDLAVPDPDADFSRLFSAAARESRLTPIELYAKEWRPRVSGLGTRLVPRVATAVAALLVLVTMSGGMAYAANGAKPGDLLYGLDLALEAIGIGDGGPEERSAEAIALLVTRVDPFPASEILTSPPEDEVEQEARTPGSDELGDAPEKLEPLEEPGDGLLAVEPGEGEVSLDGQPELTASIGGGGTSPPGPDETGEPTATGEGTSRDSTDPSEGPGEVDDSGDPTDLTVEPPAESLTAETPDPVETLRDVIDELQDIVNSNPGSPLADKVEDATAKAKTALGELAKTPPDNEAAAGNIEGAIGDLEAAVADGLLDPGHGNQLINRLAAIIDQIVQ